MTAVGQEFFDFMRKLEENNDVLPADIVEPPLEFEYNTSSCYVCNGYYLPSFGEPICVACHAHLFPDFACSIPIFYFYTEKTDDDDSGNDEPSDLNFNPGSDRRLNRPLPNEPFYAMFQEEEKASNNGVVMGRGAVGGPPSLQSSLRLLSLPRPQENLPPQRLHELPPEVLLTIFSYLDDLSLCACGRVCERWRRLLTAHVPPARWALFLERRWPLHRPLYATATHNWHKTYQSLVEASSCWSCLLQMALQSDPGGEENSWRRNRLRVEMKIMRTDPPEGIAALPLDSKCCHWQATITGPIGSPYEGGLFYLYLQVPYGYPMHPPVVRFLTRILHPNVSRHGDVGIDSVHHNWSLALTLSKVLISIQSLLTDPYTAVCMEPEVGELYRKDRVRFESLARQWTWRYAMVDALPPRSTYPSEE